MKSVEAEGSEAKKGRVKNADETKKKILEAAKKEFTIHGFDGARVDEIATEAGVNKQLLYYYFKNKDNLFVEVLKESYQKLRNQEHFANLNKMTAYEAILKLVEMDWNYYSKNPELIYLLASENLMSGRHIKEHEQEFWTINQSWIQTTSALIEKGKADGSIRTDIDPVQLNISIAGLITFSIMNRITLSYCMGVDLLSKKAIKERFKFIEDNISSWLKPHPEK